ncbi:MmgE/PrpD family protein [Paraburkholderia sp. RL17-337-BIB-A]|uniref:MmgE/PrpD family protein n=1 Tax=Paraburkholderia sp. RL17-337-BIB-A TaxID=3031636 RepID=UPI0038B7F686
MTALEQIAHWVQSPDIERLPDAGLATARLAFLDTLAVTLIGSRRAAPRIVASLEPVNLPHSTASLVGMCSRTSVARAALINGTAAHADLFDDNSAPMIAHPSASLVSALLPLAQSIGASGHDLLLAYCVGFEVGVKLGRAVNPALYEQGWHVTRVLGVLGATAACCRLARVSVEQTIHALGIATSAAGGLRQHFGTMTMALHAGWTARDAIESMQLAARGFDADPAGLDGRYGLARVFAQSEVRLPNLGESFELIESGIIFKPYPCGAPTHAAIDAALSLSANQRIDPAQIEWVVCHVHPWNAMTLRDERPSTANQARVNLRFCVAAALRFGRVTPDEFSSDALRDPLVQRLMSATDIRVDASLPDNGEFPAAVTLQLRDGRTVTERRDVPPGGTGRRLDAAQIQAKFRQCAAGVLTDQTCGRAITALTRLDALADVDALARALEGDGPQAAAPAA